LNLGSHGGEVVIRKSGCIDSPGSPRDTFAGLMHVRELHRDLHQQKGCLTRIRLELQ